MGISERVSAWAVRLAIALGVGLFAQSPAVHAQPAEGLSVSSLRLGINGDTTRFVIEVKGGDARHQVFTLADPYRVVIDLPRAEFAIPSDSGRSGKGLVSGYRFGKFEAGKSRIVLDLTAPAAVSRNFTLQPQSGFGYRIVLDLGPATRQAFLGKAGWPAEFRTAAPAPQEVTPPSSAKPDKNRRQVVVIDPGHGGVDPGAQGRSGVQEKEVVLAFAKELRRQLQATGRYQVHMTRDRDEFIRLRDRVAMARRRDADLFISIHADSIRKANVRGLSVYTLSETASDKEAAALARKENRSDVIAGVDLEGESNEVTDILIDLAQRETKNYSARFAKSVIDYAGKSTRLVQRSHRFAGFRVLKAPDVPSVLIELGFLTNREDERQLTSSKWRKKVAGSFVRAIDSYFGGRYAEGTY